MAEMIQRLRRLFPPKGQYEVFDISVLFVVLITCNYVISEPNPSSRQALQWLLSETSLDVWGVALITAGTVSAIASYRAEWMPIGMVTLGTVATLWSGSLLAGWVGEVIGGAGDPKAFGAAVLYGAFARAMIHYAAQWSHPGAGKVCDSE